MLQQAFDTAQISSMTAATEQLAEELGLGSADQKADLARVILRVAVETGVFQPSTLIAMAKAQMEGGCRSVTN